MYKKLFVLSMVVFIAFAHSFGQQTRAEIQQRQKELQQELNDLNASLSDVRQSKKLSIRELNLLQQKIEARQSLINSINNQLGDLDQTIAKYNVEVDSCKKQLDTLKSKYAESLVFAYKNRNSYNYISFLFAASSFNDAYRRIAYLKSYRQFRESQAASITKAQTTLKQNIAKLENTKQEKNGALVLQGNQLEGLQSDRNEKDSALTLLKGQEGNLTKEIAENAAKRKKLQSVLQSVIRREIAEAERKEREQQAKIAAAKRAEEDRERIEAQQKALAAKRQELAISEAKAATSKPDAGKEHVTVSPQRKAPGRIIPNRTTPSIKSAPPAANTNTAEQNVAVKQRPEQQTQNSIAATTPAKAAIPPPSNSVAINNPVDAARQNRSYNVLENTDESLTQSLDFEKNKGRLPWPVNGGFISEGYGVQTIPGTNLKEDNEGVEISSNGGSGTVKSVASGTVSVVVNDDGYSVIIRHGKYFTTYSNLSSVNVNRGDNVNAGTIIGQMSSDGSSKSMFFMVTDSRGNSLNPMGWIGGH
ncbi:MAG TPA: peptidoglycan DD-metalloendopeptidase family protein [Arachidicoccus sp.]